MYLMIGVIIGSISTLTICILEFNYRVKKHSAKAYSMGYLKGASVKKDLDELTKKQGGETDVLQ